METRKEGIACWVENIDALCRKYQEYCVDTEERAKIAEIKKQLEQLYSEGKERISVEHPELLIVLMDAYEVTRDEAALQKVLDTVSREVDRLDVSADSVRLLSYCYYYTEDEECALLAREMLRELQDRGGDWMAVGEVFRDLVGEQ